MAGFDFVAAMPAIVPYAIVAAVLFEGFAGVVVVVVFEVVALDEWVAVSE